MRRAGKKACAVGQQGWRHVPRQQPGALNRAVNRHLKGRVGNIEAERVHACETSGSACARGSGQSVHAPGSRRCMVSVELQAHAAVPTVGAKNEEAGRRGHNLRGQDVLVQRGKAAAARGRTGRHRVLKGEQQAAPHLSVEINWRGQRARDSHRAGVRRNVQLPHVAVCVRAGADAKGRSGRHNKLRGGARVKALIKHHLRRGQSSQEPESGAHLRLPNASSSCV